ncbi:MAG: LamG-like jellyroll fold domain-containing protein [Rectinemataceae bacterium]
MMNRNLLLALLVLLSVAQLLPAQDRFALVIGNGNYSSIPKLKNPVNDASDMADALRGLGFKVDLLKDANLGDMEAGVIRLGNQLGQSPGSYGFFFYAGHGIQSNGINYLIPADAQIAGEAFLKSKALAAQSVLDTLQQAGNGLNVVVLDACRDNPFSWARGGNRGLSVVGTQPPGSIIAYATSAGSVAQDGDGRNGLFTSQLLKHLRTPGIEIKEVFNRTGADVVNASNNKQVPAIYNQFFKSAWLAGAPVAQKTPTQALASLPLPTAADLISALQGAWIITSRPKGWLDHHYVFTGKSLDFYWIDQGPTGSFKAGTMAIEDLVPTGPESGRLSLRIGWLDSRNTGNKVSQEVFCSFAKSGDRLEYSYHDSSWKPYPDATLVLSHQAPGTALTPVQGLAGGIPRDGLVSEWLFNGDTKDSVKRRAGKIVDVTLGSDRFGRDSRAACFNGTTSGIDLGPVFTKPMTDWSVSLWFELASLTRTQKYFTRSPLLSNWNRWIKGSQRGWLWDLAYNPQLDHAYIDVTTCDGRSETSFASPVTPTDAFEKDLKDRWVHACLVVKGGKAVMYLDGSVEQKGSVTATMVPDPDSPLWIGQCEIDRDDKGKQIDFFDGAIDDVRIYERALEEDEVLALLDETPESTPVAAPVPPAPPPRNGLVSEWLFNGDTKDSVKRRIGKVVDVMLGSDRFGQASRAAYFNGSTSCIDMGRLFQNPVREMSASLWFSMERLTKSSSPKVQMTRSPLISNWNNYVERAQKGFIWNFMFGENYQFGGMDLAFNDGRSQVSVSLDRLAKADLDRQYVGRWIHACFVMKGGQASVYIDGALATRQKAVAEMVPEDSPFYLGRSDVDNDGIAGSLKPIDFFTGAIDDVRIYDRALEEEEVLVLFDEVR